MKKSRAKPQTRVRAKTRTQARTKTRTQNRTASPKRTRTGNPFPHRQKRELFVRRDDRRYRISFRTFFTVFLIFFGSLGTAFTYAAIGDMRTKIAAAKTELQSQKDVNAALRTEIVQKYTLDEVARIAVERLNMNKPDASQIIYINVPMQSSVELYDEDIPSDTEPLWDTIKAFFSQFIA